MLIIRSKEAESLFEILYSSSQDSMLIERFKIQFRPDPTLLLSEFEPINKNLPFAVSYQVNLILPILIMRQLMKILVQLSS